LYMDTKQFNKVLPALEKYIPLAGIDYGARRRLVTFLTYQAKDYDRSIIEAEKLLKDDPTQTTMYRWIAWSKCAKADSIVVKSADPKVLGDDAKMLYKESREASKKLFEVVPADRLVYYDFEFPAKASLKLGELEEATKYYKMVMANDSTKTCEIYTSLIEANYNVKKIKEGIDLLEEKEAKCTVTNKNREYYYAMYYAYVAKLYDKSVKYADKYIDAFPLLVDGYYYKVQSLSELDDDNNPTFKAKETSEKLITVYESKPDERSKKMAATGYNYMAYFYGKQNDLIKAKEFYQKTILVDPTNKIATQALQQLGGN
jgi:tetratricopeptide (TPR) repeat protein